MKGKREEEKDPVRERQELVLRSELAQATSLMLDKIREWYNGPARPYNWAEWDEKLPPLPFNSQFPWIGAVKEPPQPRAIKKKKQDSDGPMKAVTIAMARSEEPTVITEEETGQVSNIMTTPDLIKPLTPPEPAPVVFKSPLIEQQMDLVARLKKGQELIGQMERDLCKENGGKLPDPLPEKYLTYFERWQKLLVQYGEISRQIKASGRMVTQIDFHAICEYGNAVYVWIALDSDGSELHRDVSTQPYTEINGNTAMYKALIKALETVDQCCWYNVRLKCANALVPGQMNGTMQCNAETLIPLKVEAETLLKQCEGATIELVAKEDNRAVAVAWETYHAKFNPLNKKKAG